MEIGPDFCSYACMDRASGRIDLIRYLSFEGKDSTEELPALLKDLGGMRFSDVVICSAFEQALLIPHHLFRNNFSLLDQVYDLPAQQHLSDVIPEWQMNTIYSISQNLYNGLKQQFPEARFFHAFTPAILNRLEGIPGSQIHLHFTTNTFRVLVKRDGQVQLAQIYAYKTPLDVIYYLLKIGYEFGWSQDEITLVISGLVDRHSALYEQLHHYFLNLHFAEAPDYTLPENEHPHYYFTSLYNLAACVS